MGMVSLELFRIKLVDPELLSLKCYPAARLLEFESLYLGVGFILQIAETVKLTVFQDFTKNIKDLN